MIDILAIDSADCAQGEDAQNKILIQVWKKGCKKKLGFDDALALKVHADPESMAVLSIHNAAIGKTFNEIIQVDRKKTKKCKIMMDVM